MRKWTVCLSFPAVYVGVVECASAFLPPASASPYTYSSTHWFPNERTPIEATPLSATSAELGLGLGMGFWVQFPNERNQGKQTHPVLKHRVPNESQCVMRGLIHTGLGSSSLIAHVLHSPPPPPANSFVIGPAVINTHWVWDWVHTPPHTILSFSPPSFHTISLSLVFTSE